MSRSISLPFSLLAAAALAPAGFAASPLFWVDGTTVDWCGYAVAAAGDVDGDGHGDFLVGRPRDSTAGFRAGRVTWISGKWGTAIRESYGDEATDEFGTALAGLGDVNGDGLADVAVGAWLGHTPSGVQTGEVKVLSGADGAVLYTVYGSGGDHFGMALAAAGDVDGDGKTDFIAGADQDDDNGLDCGGAHLFSGADGTLLLSVYGSESGVKFGSTVAGPGDVNGDGVPDVAGATPWGGDTTNGYYGHVQVFSGVDGSLLREWFGASDLLRFGWSIAGPGDVDGDGRGDLLVGIRNAKPNGNASGSAHLYSGADGSFIRAHHGSAAGEFFGTAVAGTGDVDSDGTPDVIIGAPGAGLIRVHSGADGAELLTLAGTVVGDFFGSAVSGAGDLNGDLVPDILVGAGVDGYAKAWSVADLTLYASDVSEISMATGGTQTLSLDAGIPNANRSYFLVGSLSGTTPGIHVGSVKLPLNYDPYMFLTAANPNSPPLANSFATLDGGGRATATFSLPSGYPQFAGIQLHHAYVLVSPTNFASNPVPLTLVP